MIVADSFRFFRYRLENTLWTVDLGNQIEIGKTAIGGGGRIEDEGKEYWRRSRAVLRLTLPQRDWETGEWEENDCSSSCPTMMEVRTEQVGRLRNGNSWRVGRVTR